MAVYNVVCLAMINDQSLQFTIISKSRRRMEHTSRRSISKHFRTTIFILSISFTRAVGSERIHVYDNEYEHTLEHKIITQKKNLSSSCPKICHNGKACSWNICKNCDFTCSGVCTVKPSLCLSWCREQEDCSKVACKSCQFCSMSTTSSKCSKGTFSDVTELVYPKWNPFWNRLKHSRKPYFHWGAPLFVDLNNDGILDYFNSMHAGVLNDKMKSEMELGIFEHYKKDQINNPWPEINRLASYPHRVIFATDEPLEMDLHGQNIIDLDNDGVLDIFISSGGGDGLDLPNMATRDNFLFWGEMKGTMAESKIFFKGGRQTARDAGVEMSYGRGRIAYILDVNGDGLLDIFQYQDRRKSDILAPGVMLINQGRRTWKDDSNMMEYTTAMMLTDVDGDGYAEEILLTRGFCYPQRNPSTPFSDEIRQFCDTRPVGTLAVYKYDQRIGQMKEISSPFTNFTPNPSMQPPCCGHETLSGEYNCHPISLASGDFDHDLISDHIILYHNKMIIHYSSDRPIGTLIENAGDGQAYSFPSYCSYAEHVRVVDLDNDGVEEILVACRNAATFLVYSMNNNKSWTLENGCNNRGSLGDLSDISLVSLGRAELTDLCSTERNKWRKFKKLCLKFWKTKALPSVSAVGLCMVDLNNDGFLDPVVAYNFGNLLFFRNIPSEENKSNQFIAFELEGDGVNMNQYGIGATIILYTMNDNKEVNTQYREVSSHGHMPDTFGCKDDRIIFGLGKSMTPLKVEVRWPHHKFTQTIHLKWNWKFKPLLDVIKIKFSIPPSMAEQPT